MVYRREALLVPQVRAVIGFVVSVVEENAVTIGGVMTPVVVSQ